MPVYNGGHYFDLALASAARQSYDRYEVVVVDDGSTDGGEVERLCAAAGRRVRYIRQENQGVAGALNKGLAEMRGDVFCWLSHDDLFLAHKTEAQSDYFIKLAKRDAVLFSDYSLMDPQGAVVDRITANRQRLLKAPMLALLTGSINGCTIFAPINVMRDVGEFDLKYRYSQDYRYWNQLLQKYDFFHIPETLVKYRIHPNQGSNNPKANEEAEDLWIAMMTDRCEAEQVNMMGSAQLFYEKMAAHLSNSPYTRAREFALDQARRAPEKMIISIVVPVALSTSADALHDVLAWIDQLDGDLDVLVALARESQAEVPGSVRVFRATTDCDLSTLLDDALRETTGSYIVVARPGEPPPQMPPLAAAREMQARGLKSLCLHRSAIQVSREDVLLQRPPSVGLRLEDVVFHRVLIDAGLAIPPGTVGLGSSAAVLPFFDGDFLNCAS